MFKIQCFKNSEFCMIVKKEEFLKLVLANSSAKQG